MTLPTSGPISLFDIADEFQISRSTPFPQGFYGLGGAPGSGPLAFSDFYGRIRFTLSADTTALTAGAPPAPGYNQSALATVTSIQGTTFSFSGANAYITAQQVDATHATVRLVTPSAGNGSTSGTVRVTASNGDHIDINFNAAWGNA